ncbi:MAG TPA: Gfo/Idh/MocA family oxidoreductase [Flavisolibacter sp.]|nr:Gfo/Idh/MocA family oxidoreductase [Flavisolibacter sp.]
MKKLVVIGCGRLGINYAIHLARKKSLAAICDIDTSKANLATDIESTFFTNTEDLLQTVKADAVLISSPTGYHAEHAIKALQAGFDVIVAAPLCITTAATWQIIETAKYCRKQVFIIKETKDAIEVNEQQYKMINNESVEMDFVYDDTFDVVWMKQSFPGGSIFHNEGFEAIDFITKAFGVIEKASVAGDVVQLQMQEATIDLKLPATVNEKIFKLTIQGNNRGSAIKPALEESSINVSSNEYHLLLPQNVQWSTALESVDLIANIEKLEKALNVNH